MNIIIREMTENEYKVWIATSTKHQASDRASVTGKPIEEELDTLNNMLPVLLPKGISTEKHHFYSIDSKEVKNIGMLWTGSIPNIPSDSTFLFHILINDEYRSKGIGRLSMNLLHEEMKKIGYNQILLNVMNKNYAKKLYLDIGYELVEDNGHSLILRKLI